MNSGHWKEIGWQKIISIALVIVQSSSLHLDNSFPLQLGGDVDCVLRAWIKTIKPFERKKTLFSSVSLKEADLALYLLPEPIPVTLEEKTDDQMKWK